MPTVMRCMLYPYFGESVLPVLEVDCLRSSMREESTAVIMRFDDWHDIGVNGNYTIFPRSRFAAACYDLPLKVDIVIRQGEKFRYTKPGIDLHDSIVNVWIADQREELLYFIVCKNVTLCFWLRISAVEIDRIHLAYDVSVIAPCIEMRKQIADAAFDRITPSAVVEDGLEVMLANGAVWDVI